MQGRPALGQRLGGNVGANLRIGAGHGVHALGQRFEIQHSAANEHRELAARADGAYQCVGIAGKVGCVVSLQWVADIDQVVRHYCQFLGAGFGRANVHAAIHQGRVHADDFAVKGLRNGQGCSRFSGRRWAGNAQVKGQGCAGVHGSAQRGALGARSCAQCCSEIKRSIQVRPIPAIVRPSTSASQKPVACMGWSGRQGAQSGAIPST